MTDSYSVPIIKTTVKKKQVTSMHLIAGFMYILIAATTWVVINTIIKTSLMQMLNNLSYCYLFAGISIIIITIAANNKLNKPSFNITLRIIEIVLFLIIFLLSWKQNWMMIAVYGLIGIIAITITFINEIRANKPVFIHIDTKGVMLPYKMKKQLEWENINNLILKHGNFTINTKQNVLIQHPLKHNKLSKDQLQLIEAFAKKQIDMNQHKYKPDW